MNTNNVIPFLYDGINFTTIPKCIYDELKRCGHRRSSVSTRNENGIMETKYGDFLIPIFGFFSRFNFYVNEKHEGILNEYLDAGICFDKDYNKLNRHNIELFFKEYGNGFLKGYKEFENTLKDKNSLFNTSNEQIAHKIYSRIKEHWTSYKDGQFILAREYDYNKEIENKICIENNIKTILKIHENNFFESGFNGGEFYKAWEIILKNPTVFEPIFLKNISLEVEQEAHNVNTLPNNLDFNKNHWNENTLNLFNYLNGNYEKTGNVKYINIYKFLKSMNVNGYAFNFKQNDYRTFILSNFDIKLTKFAVANYKYDDIELPILSSLEEDFRKQTK